jgi:hypothetical protein
VKIRQYEERLEKNDFEFGVGYEISLIIKDTQR